MFHEHVPGHGRHCQHTVLTRLSRSFLPQPRTRCACIPAHFAFSSSLLRNACHSCISKAVLLMLQMHLAKPEVPSLILRALVIGFSLCLRKRPAACIWTRGGCAGVVCHTNAFCELTMCTVQEQAAEEAASWRQTWLLEEVRPPWRLGTSGRKRGAGLPPSNCCSTCLCGRPSPCPRVAAQGQSHPSSCCLPATYP